uniref:UDP-glycosyltransferase 1 n=1 Tax=Linum usitatissimum TaxID=4006 RepID=I2BHB0_LINUS|nr:UDP-glycosyltransferase 1 [Linum usitatissimum]
MGPTGKPHAVLIPYPAQGHINPFMQLGKLLHSKGFHITFVNNHFNHDRLLRSKGIKFLKTCPDFVFESIPDGLGDSDPDATQSIDALSDSARKYMIGPLMELVERINGPDGRAPRITCVIPDGFMGFGLVAAERLGVPGVPFWTASACGFMAYLHIGQLIEKGLIPHKSESYESDGSLDTEVGWIPGMSHARLRDLPCATRTTNPEAILLNCLRDEVQADLRAPAIIFNIFEEFEDEIFFKIKKFYPHLYPIGPLSLLENHVVPLDSPIRTHRTTLWKEDVECLDWLDTRPHGSVVYVNYGSIVVLSENDFREFAWGLANSGHAFLWIVRPDVARDMATILNEEFYSAVEGRAMLASWCAQDKVLSHPSVGTFLTHCGWNSMVEGICGGKPMICCGYFAEQPTNCHFATKVWGIGVEIDPDVKRENISGWVKEMMEGEDGKRMKNKALEWKKKAEVATDIGGSAYESFNRVLNVLNSSLE